MFEVYLNDRRDLLVVKKGSPIPLIAASGKWRRKKRVLRVSDEIRSAVQRHGYYVRKLSDAKNGSLRPMGLAHSFGHVQSLQHHHKPSHAIIALFRVINRYVGNLPPMPGVFPDYPAPVIRNADAGTEMVTMRWGMPPPPRTGVLPVTNIRNTSSPPPASPSFTHCL